MGIFCVVPFVGEGLGDSSAAQCPRSGVALVGSVTVHLLVVPAPVCYWEPRTVPFLILQTLQPPLPGNGLFSRNQTFHLSPWLAHNGFPIHYGQAWFRGCPAGKMLTSLFQRLGQVARQTSFPLVLVVEFPPTKALLSCLRRCFYSPVAAFLGYRLPILPYPCS